MLCSRCGCDSMHEPGEVERLKVENEKLRECVKFYANYENWQHERIYFPGGAKFVGWLMEVELTGDNDGTKNANQCLKEIQELNK